MWAALTKRAGADVTHGAAEAVADRFYITPEETRAAKGRRRPMGAGAPTIDGCVHGAGRVEPIARDVRVDKGRL